MRCSYVVGSLAALVAVAGASGGIFSQGNLVVVRAGDGAAALSGVAAPAFLDEYTPAGVLVQSVPMATSVSGSQRRLTLRGNGDSEGALTRSTDGRFLVLTGYDANVGTANVGTSTSATVNRIVGRVDVFGAADTSTAISDAFSGNAVRSAVSVDGSSYWVSGGTSGVRTVAQGGGATTQLAAAPTNNRFLNIFGGQLYVSSGSGAFVGVNTVGTGLPTTSGQTTTLLPGVSSAGTPSPYDYHLTSDGNTLYVADDSSGALAANAGVQKWVLSSGAWSRVNVFANTSIFTTNPDLAGFRPRNLTSTTNALGQNVLYVTGSTTAGSAIISVTDDGSSTGVVSFVAKSGTNQIFRGIEFAPVPTPGSAAVLGLGVLLAARRRR